MKDMSLWNRLFSASSEQQPLLALGDILKDLGSFWDSLGVNEQLSVTIKKQFLNRGGPCFSLLKDITLDPSIAINVRKAAMDCGEDFHDPGYASFLFEGFVKGKNPSSLFSAYENGAPDAEATLALYLQAKAILERMGYKLLP